MGPEQVAAAAAVKFNFPKAVLKDLELMLLPGVWKFEIERTDFGEEKHLLRGC
jgi:hypothetical protein